MAVLQTRANLLRMRNYRKTRKNYVLSQRTPLSNTNLEKGVRKLIDELGYEHRDDFHIAFGEWTFQIDTMILPNVIVACDGIYHETPTMMAKDRWKDSIIEKEYRIIHVSWRLMATVALREYVKKEVEAFVKSDKRVYYINV